MTKRILFLGGSHFQIPPLKYAKEQGYYVITCDYLPENPGHKYADEYHNVSTTDLGAVLALAERLKIDGIVAYASDPAAPTAAYVAERLGLPGNPYNSVLVMTRKDLWRKFLKENGFNAPKVIGSVDDIFFPMVVKPVDSSGSKGVSVCRKLGEIEEAVDKAIEFSRCNEVIIEQFIERKGYQIAGDGFLVDGELVFRCFANEHFNEGGLVPVGESFPYVGSRELQQRIHDEIQRALTLLGMKTGALNFDIVIDKDDKIYLMEIGPRNGGNCIPEVTKLVTGVDMIEMTVEAAIGNLVDFLPSAMNGFYASYMVHSLEDKEFSGVIEVSNELNIVDFNQVVKNKGPIKKFDGSHCTLGTMILKFDSEEDMLKKMDNMHDYVKAK